MSVDEKVIKTDCALCYQSCGMNIHVRGGKIVKVEGMPEHPLSRGYLCPKGKAMAEIVYAPDRLKYPLKKENGEWKRISWDEALDTIATKLKETKEKYGARALSIFCGSVGVEQIELAAFAHRFRGAYGSPNFISVESVCFRARIMTRQMTFGRYFVAEPENAKCIILWGHNPTISNPNVSHRIDEALEKGAKLIVIDPRRTSYAKMGIHIGVKPGTDLALALAMLNVIISEGLYDKEFVETWTIGFDTLKEHVKQYPPEKVEEITWVPAVDIKRIARIYATTKPACIVQGICSLDQQTNGVQNNRALSILQAVTGNIDAPGGWTSVPFIRLADLRLPVEEKPIGADKHPLFYEFWGRKAPYGQALEFPRAVLEGKPHPIKALIVVAGNPAISMPDSRKWKEAMENLNFLVVMDLFMTETAELADIVLPACTCFEKTGVAYDYGVNWGVPYVMLRKKAIEPLWESWPEWKFWSELGRRMGYGEYFPWKTGEEFAEHFLKPSGVTFQQLMENPEGVFFASKSYKRYEKSGFRTPSGKIELYSKTLEEAGYDPLPTYGEVNQNPGVAEEYPLICVTGPRILEFTHTQMRNIPELRRGCPEPIAEIHPSTAREYGILDDEKVIFRTKNGSVRFKVKTTKDILPQVVSIPHGWAQANVNVLTDIEARDPISGYPELKALLCRIKKA